MTLGGSLGRYYIGQGEVEGKEPPHIAICVFILCAPSDQTDLKSMEGYFAWLPRRRRRKPPEGGGHRAK